MFHANGLIVERDGWVVEQCRGCLLPGYLIVRPIVPVQGLSALPAEAASQLGPLLQVVVRSIEAVLSPARVYVAQFGEEQQDLHFHVFPRTAAVTADYLQQHQGPHSVISGPLLFDWARDRYRANTASTETVRVFEALRQRLRVDR